VASFDYTDEFFCAMMSADPTSSFLRQLYLADIHLQGLIYVANIPYCSSSSRIGDTHILVTCLPVADVTFF
jgi:hypothetical protein